MGIFNVDFASLLDMDMITSGLMSSGHKWAIQEGWWGRGLKKVWWGYLKDWTRCLRWGSAVLHVPLWGRVTGWIGWAINAAGTDTEPVPWPPSPLLEAQPEQIQALVTNKRSSRFVLFQCWQLSEQVSSFEERLISALIKIINLESICSTCFAGCQIDDCRKKD